jgi:peptidoglycan/LPS O-acetylase OafA/YrhL
MRQGMEYTREADPLFESLVVGLVMHSVTSAYRADIDGLRAIAVLQVIFFHAGFTFARSGFIGVDVFFVISGFLITGILLQIRNEQTIGLLEFYQRRVRRILPVLFTVTLFSIPFAYFLMLPDDLENFGQSQVATVFSANNFLLWLTENYFSVRNEFKPLVHTWSLGVEEQFYLIYPVLFFFAFKIRNYFSVLKSLSFLWILSFIAAIWCSAQASSTPHGINNLAVASFFLLPTRAFELLTGAIAFFVLHKRDARSENGFKSSAIKCFGCVLIIGSAFVLPLSENYPNFFTLIPLLGTFMFLVVEKDSLVTPFVTNRKLVRLGLASFSIYLIHQPLFAFYRLSMFRNPDWFEYLILIIVAIVMGFLSFRYIETPFRNRDLFSFKKVLVVLMVMSILILFSGSQFVMKSGYFRGAKFFPVQSNLHQGLNAEFNMKPFRYLRGAFIQVDKKKILVIGNSQARDFVNALITTPDASSLEVVYRNDFDGCITEQTYDTFIEKLIHDSDYVVFGSVPTEKCWPEFRKVMNDKIDKILVLGEKNFGANVNAVMIKTSTSETKVDIRIDVINRNQRSQGIFGINFIDMNTIIGNNGYSVPILDENGYLISQDGTHLTPSGALFLGEKMVESKKFNFTD